MDRILIYPTQIPLESDLLNTNRSTMIALGKLAAAVFGTGTFVNGLTVAPNSPAALNVVVSPGEIYSLQNIDGTAYSSLSADTTHSVVKQGIMLDAVTLATAAPATAGQSINYLIQAAYQDSDTGLVALPYYNASNPAQAYSGPNNSGTAQATARKGIVNITAKAGISATTGSQTTPAPDAGYVGLYVVTVANGQTTVTAPNIAVAANAPFINTTLHGLAPAFGVSPTAPTPAQFDNSTKVATMAAVQRALGNAAGVFAFNGGVVGLDASYIGKIINNYGAGAATVNLPSITGIATGAGYLFVNNIGSGPMTVNVNGADLIANAPLSLTSLVLGSGDTALIYAVSSSQWILVGGSYNATGRLINVQTFSASGTYTPTPGTKSVVVEVQGGGGGGGGAAATTSGQLAGGAGGNSGAYGKSRLTSGFAGVAVTIGAGGAGGAIGGAGAAGGTSSFGALVSAPGGAGGLASAAITPPIVQYASANANQATGGNVINAAGIQGGISNLISVSASSSGAGAQSLFGGGGGSIPSGAGLNALAKGAGGGGALNGNVSAGNVGGAGAAGLVIVLEFA